jgi:hypothetical protein
MRDCEPLSLVQEASSMSRLLAALALLVFSNVVRAEPLIPMPPNRGPLIPYSYSPYANGIRVTTAITASRTFPAPLALQAQTSVNVPDGGTVRLGGYSTMRDGRNEFGSPGIGRPLRNVGYGRSISGSTIAVKARVIILAEEEERQTGVRSR